MKLKDNKVLKVLLMIIKTLMTLVVVVVLIIGFAQTYRAIKRKYKDEIESNKANA